MSSRSIDASEFEDFLATCRQRFVAHSMLRGMSCVVLTSVGAILCAGLFDFLIPLPGYLRVLLLLGMLVMTLVSACRHILRPLMRGISDAELGAAADLAFPELDEALATLASVESPNTSVAEAGSAVMRRKLWQQTRPQLTTASHVSVMESGTTARHCGAAASIILIALLPLFAWRSGSLLLLQRFLFPFQNYPTATNLYFDILSPGDVMARGDDVVFQAQAMWRSGTDGDPPSEATLLLDAGSGRSDSMQMKYDRDNGCYTATLREISSSLEWRINAGRTTTEVRTLRVVDRPQLADAVLTAIPPAYTGLPPRQWPGIAGTMDVLQGSEITMTLASRAPIASAELIWPGNSEGQPQATDGSSDERAIPFTLHDDDASASLSFPAERGGMFKLRLTDHHNITNHDEQHRQLRLYDDEPPTLSVRGVRSQETMRPDAIVPVNVLAQDDIGLASLELHVQRNEDVAKVISAVDLIPGDQEFDSEFRTELSEMDLADGDNVQLRVRATDGHVPEFHEVWSDIIQVRIDSNANPVGADAMNESTRQLVEQLEAVRRELRKDTQAINELKRQTSESWTASSQANATRLSEQEQQRGRQLEDQAHHASRHPLMTSPAADLNQLASALREEVAGYLNEADTSDSDAAAAALDQSKQALLTARSELDRIIEQIEQAGKLEQDLARLNHLALESEQLAQDARQYHQQPNSEASGSSAESERIESVRRKLTNDLTNLLDEQARLRDAAQQSVRNRLNDAASQAAELAEQQQQVSDGLSEQADTRGDAVEPQSDTLDAGTENLLNRIKKLASAAQQMSETIPDQASTGPAKQLRESAARAAELFQTGQFTQSAEMLRNAADAASQQQQISDSMSQDQKQQSDRLQNQLTQAASLIADLERNDDAQLALQGTAQRNIAAATKELASDLSHIQGQIRMPALDMQQEQTRVEAAEQSSVNAVNTSKVAADRLSTGQLRDAAETGAQAAAALHRVSEIAQQLPAARSEDAIVVPTEVGRSVTDALQNLNDAAQSTSGSSGGHPTDTSNGELASEEAGRRKSADNAEESSSAGGAQSNPPAPSDNGAITNDAEGGGQKGESGDGSRLDDQRARRLMDAAAALSDAARQSLPSLNDNDATGDSNGQQAGTGASSDGTPGFAADLAAPPPAGQQRDWRRLNDELSSDLLSGDQESGDARYGSLIRAYFRQLARQSAKTNQRIAP